MTPSISARLASWPSYLDPTTAQVRVQEVLTAKAAGLCLPFVITHRTDGVVFGWISACRAEADPRRAVLTYWIGEPFHGRGLMREAVPAALEAIFNELGVTEVRAAVQSDNEASRAVLRSIGMRPLGQGRIWCAARGQEETCEWWAIQRPEVVSGLSHVVPSLAGVFAAAS